MEKLAELESSCAVLNAILCFLECEDTNDKKKPDEEKTENQKEMEKELNTLIEKIKPLTEGKENTDTIKLQFFEGEENLIGAFKQICFEISKIFMEIC